MLDGSHTPTTKEKQTTQPATALTVQLPANVMKQKAKVYEIHIQK